MKRLLFDANVLLDVALAREPHFAAATACTAAVENGRCVGLVSAHAVTTLFYLCRRPLGTRRAQNVVADLLTIFEVAPVDGAILRRAITFEATDFEDAVTAAAAEAAHCDAIVTRDPKGFSRSSVRTLDPGLVLALLAEEIQEKATPYGRRRSRRNSEPKR